MQEYKLEKYQIDLDEARYGLANMQLVARDRMREIKLWSTLKKEFDDGSFDTQDVNRHQLDSYHLIMKNKAETLTQGSSQPEVFNVLGQLHTLERVRKSGELLPKGKEKKKRERRRGNWRYQLGSPVEDTQRQGLSRQCRG